MESTTLTGAQKSRLRARGQGLEPALKVGRSGLTPAFWHEFGRLLEARELVKLRFEAGDRRERAEWIARIEVEAGVPCVGVVRRTALFYRVRRVAEGDGSVGTV